MSGQAGGSFMSSLTPCKTTTIVMGSWGRSADMTIAFASCPIGLGSDRLLICNMIVPQRVDSLLTCRGKLHHTTCIQKRTSEGVSDQASKRAQRVQYVILKITLDLQPDASSASNGCATAEKFRWRTFCASLCIKADALVLVCNWSQHRTKPNTIEHRMCMTASAYLQGARDAESVHLAHPAELCLARCVPFDVRRQALPIRRHLYCQHSLNSK